MTDDTLFFAPAWDLAGRIRRRELSATEVMEATLRRIEALEPTLNAFAALRPGEALLAEASRMDERIARGEDPGPLAGLPFGVKDLEDLEGLPNTHGSLLFRDAISPRDSIQVERLRRAGAIPIGKTTVPEFGGTCFTKNRVHGVTRSPWDPGRTPGGSSGGSAAALAAGMVPLATSEDGGGSIRIPAAFSGLVGLKTMYGRVPLGPEEIVRWTGFVVRGPMTRTVRDAALWLDVTVGPHELDPWSLAHPGFSYVERIREDPPRLRIAYDPTLGYATVAKATLTEVEAALEALERAGHHVDLVEDDIEDVVIHWAAASAIEEYGLHHELLDARRGEVSRGFLVGVDLAKQMTAQGLGEVQRARARLAAWLDGLFERYDLLATPTVACLPFAAEGPIPREIDGRPVESPGGAIAFTYPFNLSNHPAISLRAGLAERRLPVGIQLVAPRHREDLLLQLAREYEEIRPWADAWPRL